MKIYTSYFAQLNHLIEDNIYPISIARYSPAFFTYPEWKSVAPSKSILFQIKNSAHTETDKQIYTERYIKEILEIYQNPLYLIQELYNLVPDNVDKVALLCYEKPSDFCHRHILSKWLNEKISDLNITEYIHKSKNNVVESFSNSLF